MVRGAGLVLGLRVRQRVSEKNVTVAHLHANRRAAKGRYNSRGPGKAAHLSVA